MELRAPSACASLGRATPCESLAAHPHTPLPPHSVLHPVRFVAMDTLVPLYRAVVAAAAQALQYKLHIGGYAVADVSSLLLLLGAYHALVFAAKACFAALSSVHRALFAKSVRAYGEWAVVTGATDVRSPRARAGSAQLGERPRIYTLIVLYHTRTPPPATCRALARRTPLSWRARG